MAKPEELKKFIDEEDEKFTGFCNLRILDQDGYEKKTKGSVIEAPLFMEKRDGKVILEAEFPADPLFYLAVQKEEGMYLMGQWWLGSGGWARTNQICSLIPKLTQAIHAAMEKSGGPTFEVSAEMPFLKNSPSRLITVSFVSKEQRFTTKVVRASVQIPEADWSEYKQYRSRLWQSWKVWSGKDENEKKDKKEEKDK